MNYKRLSSGEDVYTNEKSVEYIFMTSPDGNKVQYLLTIIEPIV